MFQEDVKDPSRLVHGPLQEQLKEISIKSVKASESVKHRYERTTSNVESVERHARARAVSVSVSSEEVELKKEGRTFAKRPEADSNVRDSLGSWRRWWSRWCEGTGRQVDEQRALQCWISYVCLEDEDVAFACLESYLSSADVANGKVKNGWKFITEESENKWRSRWPTPMLAAVPRKLSLAEQMIAEIKEKESANGTR